MRGKTLGILSLAVALLALVVWLDRQQPGSDERQREAELLLPGLAPGEVLAVTLWPQEALAGGTATPRDAVRLERADEHWEIAAPGRWAGRRADASAVDEMLASLADLRWRRQLDDVVEAEVGLDRPRARARLERAAGAPWLLEVGGEVPASGSSVVRVSEVAGGGADGAPDEPAVGGAGGGVYLVDGEILGHLLRAEWRDRELFHHARGDVLGVTLEGPEGRVELARRVGGPGIDGFDVVQPFDDVADDEMVASLLATLEKLTAERFVDGGAAGDEAVERGLDPPLGTVTVELTPDAPAPAAPPPAAADVEDEAAEGNPRRTLAEGLAAAARSLRITVGRPRPDGTVYLRLDGDSNSGGSDSGGSDSVGSVGGGADGGDADGGDADGGGAGPGEPLLVATRTLLAEELSMPPVDWVSHLLTEHRAFDVTGLVVVDGGERLDFDRKGDDWSMDGEPVSYLPLSEVLNAITEARADELVHGAPSPPGPVTRSFTLRVKNGVERIETIRFHGAAGDDGRVRVTVDGRPPVFVLTRREAERIDRVLQELRDELRKSGL